MDKKKISEEINKLKKEITIAKEKDNTVEVFILYKEFAELRKNEAVLLFKDPLEIQSEINHHIETQNIILRQLGHYKMETVINAIGYNTKVIQLLNIEKNTTNELEKQAAIFRKYEL
jgi:hypothetical protein